MLTTLATRGVRRMTTQAAVATDSVRATFLDQLLFDAPSQPPLNEKFPGVPESSGAAAPSAVQVSKLGNGVTVASVDQAGPVSSIGVSVKSGSAADAVRGTAYTVAEMAFRSTQKRSAAKLMRDIERFGGRVNAGADRETISYTATSLRDHTRDAAGALAETVMQPKLAEWEVREAAEHIVTKAADERSNPEVALSEQLHNAAFGYASPLGRETLPGSSLGVSVDDVRSYLGTNFVSNNVVVVGTNVDHAQLVDLADLHFLGIPEGSTSSASSEYVGGQVVTRTEGSGTSYVGLGFKAPAEADSAATQVLRALLGRGKNGYCNRSRLGEKGDDFPTAAAQTNLYAETGLFSVTASVADGNVPAFVNTVAEVLKGVAGGATDDEVAWAKRVVALQVASSYEGSSAVGTMARSLALRGEVTPLADALAAVSKVTTADVAAAAKGLMSSVPSVAVIGAAEHVPRYDLVVKQFQ